MNWQEDMLVLQVKQHAIKQQIKALKRQRRLRNGSWLKRSWRRCELGLYDLIDSRRQHFALVPSVKNVPTVETSIDEQALLTTINKIFDHAEMQIDNMKKTEV